MGAKEERFDEIQGVGGGHHAWEFLFNFSKVTENAFVTIKLLIFSTPSVIFFSKIYFIFFTTLTITILTKLTLLTVLPLIASTDYITATLLTILN